MYIKKAEKNTDTVMPELTHLKNAQPISFAHHLLAYYEMLKETRKDLKIISIFSMNVRLVQRRYQALLIR